MRWHVVVTPLARKMIKAIADKRIQKKIGQRIEELAQDPEIQGKPLLGELAGCYSVRTAGQRYRILYRIERRKIIINVVAVGMRKEKDKRDIYALAKKLMRLHLLDDPGQ